MQMAVKYRVFGLFLIYFVTNTSAKQTTLSSTDPITLIKSLASSGRASVIIVIKPKKPKHIDLTRLLPNDGLKSSGSLEDNTAKQDAKTMLYDYLRSSPYDSPKEQKKKQSLRQALRQRCLKVTTCVQECQLVERPSRPKKKECPNICQFNYDQEQLCNPTGGKKWGSTMPPKWLMKLL